MNKMNLKFWLMGLLFVSLIGGVIVVQNNQDLQKGAAVSESSLSVLPSRVNTIVGNNFNVNVWVNTGISTRKMTEAKFVMSFDSDKVEYVSSVAVDGYKILSEYNMVGQSGMVFDVVSDGEGKSKSFQLLKVTFKALSSQNGAITFDKGAMFTISPNNVAMYVSKYYGNTHGLTGGIGVTKVCKTNNDCKTTELCYQPTGCVKSKDGSEACMLAQKYCKLKVVKQKVVSNGGGESGQTSLICNWCGSTCVKSGMKGCSAAKPASNKICIPENNKCVIKTMSKDDTSVSSPEL